MSSTTFYVKYLLLHLLLASSLRAAPAPTSTSPTPTLRATITTFATPFIQARDNTAPLQNIADCGTLYSLITGTASETWLTPYTSLCACSTVSCPFLKSCKQVSIDATSTTLRTVTSTSCLDGNGSPVPTTIAPVPSCSDLTTSASKASATTLLTQVCLNPGLTTATIYPTSACDAISSAAKSTWTTSSVGACMDPSGHRTTETFYPTITDCTYWSKLASSSKWTGTTTELCITNGQTIPVPIATTTVVYTGCTQYYSSSSTISSAITATCSAGNNVPSTVITVYPACTSYASDITSKAVPTTVHVTCETIINNAPTSTVTDITFTSAAKQSPCIQYYSSSSTISSAITATCSAGNNVPSTVITVYPACTSYASVITSKAVLTTVHVTCETIINNAPTSTITDITFTSAAKYSACTQYYSSSSTLTSVITATCSAGNNVPSTVITVYPACSSYASVITSKAVPTTSQVTCETIINNAPASTVTAITFTSAAQYSTCNQYYSSSSTLTAFITATCSAGNNPSSVITVYPACSSYASVITSKAVPTTSQVTCETIINNAPASTITAITFTSAAQYSACGPYYSSSSAITSFITATCSAGNNPSSLITVYPACSYYTSLITSKAVPTTAQVTCETIINNAPASTVTAITYSTNPTYPTYPSPSCISIHANITEEAVTSVPPPAYWNSLMYFRLQQGHFTCIVVPGVIPYIGPANHQYPLSCDASAPGAGGYIVYDSQASPGKLSIVYRDKTMHQSTTTPLQGVQLHSSDIQYGGAWRWDVDNLQDGCVLSSS